ncbi:coiled-coil domain-containing protein 172 [Tachysurus ichikawai]
MVKRYQSESYEKPESILMEPRSRERIKREVAEEKEKFMNTIRTFNSDFNLLKNRDLVFHHQTKSEIQTLQSESEALSREIERLKQEKTQLITLQTEQQSLSAELKGLHSQLADVERELEEAAAHTESLKIERETAIQKPQRDSTCLRLKKDLEAHKELEMLHATLSTEIHVLLSQLQDLSQVQVYALFRMDESPLEERKSLQCEHVVPLGGKAVL